ncbi:MAG: hypothetical protein LAP85_02105 [Acidobacteriia bacterium]|nr:hypothetical protein [Terriglobia bacterium]
MMLQSLIFVFTMAIWFQGGIPPPQASSAECVTAVEKKQLAAEEKIDGRIKIYRQISERLHQAVQSDVAKKDFNEVPALVRCWKEQLTSSLKDIETNINRKKKSGALINYEIQLRKSIVDMSDARLRAPLQQQSEFESWLAEANRIREKFVDILFQR